MQLAEYVRNLRENGKTWEEACFEIKWRAKESNVDIDAQLCIVDDVYCEPPYDWEYKKKNRYVKKIHTKYEWEEKKRQYNYRCFYCGKKTKDLCRDHIVPISKNGTDHINNIIPSCRSCNSRKKDRDLESFIPEGTMFKFI